MQNLIFANSQAAATPAFELTLGQSIQSAEKNSGLIHSAEAKVQAYDFQTQASKATLLPNFTLQASYSYQAVVPSLSLGQMSGQAGSFTFGTHDNYSVGPVLTYTVFDFGQRSKQSDSIELLSQAGSENLKTQKSQVKLTVRQIYFKVQYALKQVLLTSNSLKLSQSQSHDIDLRFQAGASSRLDALQAQRDVTNYQLRFRQAQVDLAGNLRDLIALTGEGQELDTSRPIPTELESDLPPGVEPPSLVIKLDALNKTAESFSNLNGKPKTFTAPTSSHPELKSLEQQTASYRQLAESATAGLWPKIQVQAKGLYQYPNVVVPQAIWQGIFGASLVFPLFEGDASRSLSAQHRAEALSVEHQREQKGVDLNRDFNKALDQLTSLKNQRKLSEENNRQATEVQRLTYESYQAGKARLLDVQDANLKSLQAQVGMAQIESELLIELAALEYLSNC